MVHADNLPSLPDEIWTHIYELLALDLLATECGRAARTWGTAHFQGFKVRKGVLRWMLRYIRKGRFVQTRAEYSCVEHQARGHVHCHTLSLLAV